MVEIFKTNVQDSAMATTLVSELLELFPGYRINFDLEDCDRILRVESQRIAVDKIAVVLNGKGFVCEVLE